MYEYKYLYNVNEKQTFKINTYRKKENLNLSKRTYVTYITYSRVTCVFIYVPTSGKNL